MHQQAVQIPAPPNRNAKGTIGPQRLSFLFRSTGNSSRLPRHDLVATMIAPPQPASPLCAHAADRLLLDRAIARQPGAWADLQAHLAPAITRCITATARQWWPDAHAADLEDLTADVLLRLVVDDFARLRAWQGNCTLRTWVRVVATRFLIDRLRTRKVGRSLEDPTLPALADTRQPDAERVAAGRQSVARLQSALPALSTAERQFFDLFFVQEFSFDEIHAQTGISLEALYQRKTRVCRTLRHHAETHGWRDAT